MSFDWRDLLLDVVRRLLLVGAVAGADARRQPSPGHGLRVLAPGRCSTGLGRLGPLTLLALALLTAAGPDRSCRRRRPARPAAACLRGGDLLRVRLHRLHRLQLLLHRLRLGHLLLIRC